MPYKGYTQAHNKANQRYQQKAYEQMSIKVKKGRRDIYKQLAEMRGASLAGMITSYLDKLSIESGLMVPDDDGPEEDPEEDE